MADEHSLLLRRIAARLHELFDDQIDLKDVEKKPAEERENFFLSRALAALALTEAADLPPNMAGSMVTDGGADDGIDAIYVDDKKKVIYFVQSKWRSSKGGIKLAEFTRFRDGVQKVISLQWDADNNSLHRFRPSIEKTLEVYQLALS